LAGGGTDVVGMGSGSNEAVATKSLLACWELQKGCQPGKKTEHGAMGFSPGC
jgi:hypothetical protein